MSVGVITESDTTPVGDDGWCHTICDHCDRRLCDGQPAAADCDCETDDTIVCGDCGLPFCPPCEDLCWSDCACPWCGAS